jgi:hypothetical protein
VNDQKKLEAVLLQASVVASQAAGLLERLLAGKPPKFGALQQTAGKLRHLVAVAIKQLVVARDARGPQTPFARLLAKAIEHERQRGA